MNKALGDVFDQTVAVASGMILGPGADTLSKNVNIRKPSDSHNREEKQRRAISDIATPTFSQPSTTQHARAILVEVSSTTFGNECLRLVNIVFQTSQTFPSMMGTCGDVSQFLRKELFKQYPGEYFHIVIGQNNSFGFAIDDSDYFAEMEQEQYRVLIFATKLDKKVRQETHDSNSQMPLDWKTLLAKPLKK